MSNIYRCDGCKEVRDGDPTFTVERTDGTELFGESGSWHACTWRCVARVAHHHEMAQGTWAPGSADSHEASDRVAQDQGTK